MLYRLHLKMWANVYGLIGQAIRENFYIECMVKNARWEKWKRCIVPERWKVRGCPISWPPISPDPSRLDLFHMIPYEKTNLRVSYWNIYVSINQDCFCCRKNKCLVHSQMCLSLYPSVVKRVFQPTENVLWNFIEHVYQLHSC